MRRLILTLALGFIVIGVRQHPVVHAQSDSSIPINISPERALAFVHAAEQHLDYVPGEVLVKFKGEVSANGQERALAALRSRPAISDLQWIGDVGLLTDQSEQDATILAAQLSTQPEVAYAEPNYLQRTTSDPNDPGFDKSQWNFKALDMPRAWDLNPGASNKLIVAVVDTGITTVNRSFTAAVWNGFAIQNFSIPFGINPDLAANRLVSPRDFITGMGSIVLDTGGHGTHVSATIGEDTNNAIAEAGIAYRVQVMPIKACLSYWDLQFMMAANGLRGFLPIDSGGCSSDAVANGIRYAVDNGAKVINLSLGGTLPSSLERDAIIYAVGKGAFVAIASGNGYVDHNNAIEYPAGFAPSIDGAMSVGAVGRSLKRASYSTSGPQVEIAAPGGDIDDGDLEGMIWQGAQCMGNFDPEFRQYLLGLPPIVVPPRFDQYCETPLQGTSMASPHVAGVAALIMSQGVMNPAAVEALIKATARDLGAPGRDNEFGYGLIQPRAALFGQGVTR